MEQAHYATMHSGEIFLIRHDVNLNRCEVISDQISEYSNMGKYPSEED